MFGFLKKEQVEPPLPAVPTIWSTPSFQEHGPRVVRFTTSTRATILITRALSIATILFGMIAVVRIANRTEQFATKGEIFPAEVVRLRANTGKNNRGTITYEYQFDGRVFAGQETLNESAFESIKLGDFVQVTVLASEPDSPWYGLVDREEARKQQLLGSVIVMGLSLAFGIWSTSYRAKAKRHLGILRGWQARPAQAIRVTSESAGKQGTTYLTQYRVLMPNGQVREFLHSETGSSGPRANPGDDLTAFVNPNDPREVTTEWDIETVELAPPGTSANRLYS